jgi:phthalate 4,5-dioxygenase
MAFDAGPRIEVDDTDFGFHYAALRGGEAPGQDVHVRITAVTAPFFVANPNEDLWMCVVPINDHQSSISTYSSTPSGR